MNTSVHLNGEVTDRVEEIEERIREYNEVPGKIQGKPDKENEATVEYLDQQPEEKVPDSVRHRKNIDDIHKNEVEDNTSRIQEEETTRQIEADRRFHYLIQNINKSRVFSEAKFHKQKEVLIKKFGSMATDPKNNGRWENVNSDQIKHISWDAVDKKYIPLFTPIKTDGVKIPIKQFLIYEICRGVQVYDYGAVDEKRKVLLIDHLPVAKRCIGKRTPGEDQIDQAFVFGIPNLKQKINTGNCAISFPRSKRVFEMPNTVKISYDVENDFTYPAMVRLASTIMKDKDTWVHHHPLGSMELLVIGKGLEDFSHVILVMKPLSRKVPEKKNVPPVENGKKQIKTRVQAPSEKNVGENTLFQSSKNVKSIQNSNNTPLFTTKTPQDAKDDKSLFPISTRKKIPNIGSGMKTNPWSDVTPSGNKEHDSIWGDSQWMSPMMHFS